MAIAAARSLGRDLILSSVRVFVFFFFFQAEDGIRDTSVTGVQTCALPISSPVSASEANGRSPAPMSPKPGQRTAARWARRSEERRVGKECRSRWSPEAEKKKRARACIDGTGWEGRYHNADRWTALD